MASAALLGSLRKGSTSARAPSWLRKTFTYSSEGRNPSSLHNALATSSALSPILSSFLFSRTNGLLKKASNSFRVSPCAPSLAISNAAIRLTGEAHLDAPSALSLTIRSPSSRGLAPGCSAPSILCCSSAPFGFIVIVRFCIPPQPVATKAPSIKNAFTLFITFLLCFQAKFVEQSSDRFIFFL